MTSLLSFLIFASFTITDQLGREVKFAKHPERIVVLASDILETVLAIKPDAEIVGISKSARENKFLPKEVREKPVCGSWRSVDVEKLLLVEPDVVILMGKSSLTEEIVRSLESRGLKTVVIAPSNLDELVESITILGKLLGREKQADSLKMYMLDRIHFVRSLVGSLPRVKVYLCGMTPYTTFGKGSVWGSIVEIAGGNNVAMELNQPWPRISVEKLIEWDPDVILITWNAPYSPRWFYDRTELRVIKAVKEKRIYKLSQWLSWSPRIILGIMEMAKCIHGEACQSINLDYERQRLRELTLLNY